MKTISYYNRKGGVGKTTVSFLFSRFLISAGKKVLILDLDPQKSLTSHFTRLHKIDRKRLKEQNAFTVLLGKDDINEAIIQIDFPIVTFFQVALICLIFKETFPFSQLKMLSNN